MARPVYRAALWAIVVIVLASTIAAIPGGASAAPTYTLNGFVSQPAPYQGAPVPNGVQVDLVSRATGAVYTATTYGGGGEFTFNGANTGGTLAPGYWGVYVPPEGNISLPNCAPCAVLPQQQSPTFAFYSTSDLTGGGAPVEVTNVSTPVYNSTISGTVYQGSNLDTAGVVQLLDPVYNSLVLVSNITNSSTAKYSVKAPLGTYVLESLAHSAPPQARNETQVTVTPSGITVNPIIRNYLVSGLMLTPSGARIQTAGNVTLYDATNGYIYSAATPPGGFYALGTYPAGFITGGSQTFEAILSSTNYSTSAYSFSVSGTSQSKSQNVNLAPLQPNQIGDYETTLDFSGVNVASGTGNLSVRTVENLGNDTTFPNLPNATVGQLWAQLGLDFAHSLSFSSTSLPSVYQFENRSGPFFPAVQAGTAINGTTFVGPNTAQSLSGYTSTCSGTCGLSTAANLTLTWSNAYKLNGTLFRNSSAYSFAFNFRHPTTSGDVYNYTVLLPAGYVLKAGTAVPSDTKLVARGTGGTWTEFTLSSYYSATAAGSFAFQIVTYSHLTAVVNATVTNFAFSSHNVLNQTNGNYTVLVGVGQNVTWSALNSLYPAGNNGTKFAWAFGDGGTWTNSTPTAWHTYTTASAATPLDGSLTVTSSGGLVNTTHFHVWVGEGPVTAGMAINATAAQTRTAGGTTYLYVNWSSVLQFNATRSSAKVSPTATIPGNVSVASYSLSYWGGFTTTVANYSVAHGSSYLAFSNASYQFFGAGTYLSAGRVNGTSVPFHGWQANLTMTVWASTGQSAKSTLVILVNDTQKPTASYSLLDVNYRTIGSSKTLVAQSNLSALVRMNGAASSDPGNGSVVAYYWWITNPTNSSVHIGINRTSANPNPTAWLSASTSLYWINLTVTDMNGNRGWLNQSLSVTANTTLTPILTLTNMTGPSGTGSQKLNAGTTYTFWVNVTTKAASGKVAVANGVQVTFYLTSPGGTSRTIIAGSPGSVTFYNYTSGGVANALVDTGTVASLAYNQTLRAQIRWTPGTTGNYDLYANATATNQFSGNLGQANVAQVSITVNPNPTTQLLEYVAIGVAVVVVLGLIIFYYRRRSRGPRTTHTRGRSGLERGSRKSDEDEEDDE